MIRVLFTLALCLLTLCANSQSEEEKKLNFGVQTGYLGIWFYGDLRLSDQFVVRSEMGFDSGRKGANLQYESGITLTPLITLEPRLYYNTKKSENKSDMLRHNTGNFFSLKTTFRPNWVITSNDKDRNEASNISIIPTWGIRRNIGGKFNYETGFGFGYSRYFSSNNSDNFQNKSTAILNLHLRIGFRL